MTRIKLDNGWSEVITTNIEITKIWINFQTNESWRSSFEKGPISPKGRTLCECCGSNWKDNGSDIALAFTDKGNKIICQSCADFFSEKGIETVINKTI